MHPYSIDSDERQQVSFGLAILAVLLAFALSRTLHVAQLTAPWWLDAPSTMGFYGVLSRWFDQKLWRLALIRWPCSLKVPVLAGEWRGYVVSSFDEHKKAHEVKVRINQSWNRIMILLSSATSDSHTLTASVQIEAPDGIVLTYQYQNQPKADALTTMEMHTGTARLLFEDGRVLEGYYYSGRGREQYGSIHLERVQQ